MESSVITPEDVLESLMNDGTIDAIRLKIINQLKANEELKNNTIKMVEQSKVLNTHDAEKQTKRELFDAIRQELDEARTEKERDDTPTSSSKKRSFGEISEEDIDEVAQVSADEPVVPQSINALPSPK